MLIMVIMMGRLVSLFSCIRVQALGISGSWKRSLKIDFDLELLTITVLCSLNYEIMSEKKRKTFLGRVLKGIGLGIMDGIPFISQVVNTVQDRTERDPDVDVPRVLMGWTTVVLVVAIGVFRYFDVIDQDLFMNVITKILGF